MPKVITLVGVNYDVVSMYADQEAYERGDDPQAVHLKFADAVSGETYVVQFDAQPWQRFKRQVSSDGRESAPDIVVAGAAPPPPRMDIPRGR